ELESLLQRNDAFPRRGFARFAAYWRGRCALAHGDHAEAGRQLSRALALSNPQERLWHERISEYVRQVEEGTTGAPTVPPAGYAEGREALRFAEQQASGWRA